MNVEGLKGPTILGLWQEYCFNFMLSKILN